MEANNNKLDEQFMTEYRELCRRFGRRLVTKVQVPNRLPAAIFSDGRIMIEVPTSVQLVVEPVPDWEPGDGERDVGDV